MYIVDVEDGKTVVKPFKNAPVELDIRGLSNVVLVPESLLMGSDPGKNLSNSLDLSELLKNMTFNDKSQSAPKSTTYSESSHAGEALTSSSSGQNAKDSLAINFFLRAVNDDSSTIKDRWDRMMLGTARIMSEEDLDNVVDNDDLQEGSYDERKSWQNMLSEAISGELIRVEKKKLSDSRYEHFQEKEFRDQIWLELRAYVRSTSVEEELASVAAIRASADRLVKEVMEFRLPANLTRADSMEIVSSLIRRMQKLERSYSSTKALKSANLALNDYNFSHKMDCLISWQSITHGLDHMHKSLCRWISALSAPSGKNNDDLALSEWMKISRYGSFNKVENVCSLLANLGSKRKFVEVLLKETGIKKTFERVIFQELRSLLQKSRLCHLSYHNEFAAMNLPYFDEMVHQLTQFPYRLMREFMKLRLEFVDGLQDDNASLPVVDQILDDIKESLSLFMSLKHELYGQMMDAVVGTPPNSRSLISDNERKMEFEMMNKGIAFYLRLVKRKSMLGSKVLGFKETEMLETEWQFIQTLFEDFPPSMLIAAEEFGRITQNLIHRLETYLNTSIVIPDENTNPVRWFARVLENLRLRARKFLRFYRFLAVSFEDSIEVKITDPELLIRKLMEHNYVMVSNSDGKDKTTPKEHPIHVFVDSDLASHGDSLGNFLIHNFSFLSTSKKVKEVYSRGLSSFDPHFDKCSVLFYKGPPFITWMGATVELCDMSRNYLNESKVAQGLSLNKLRLVAKNPSCLTGCKKQFFSCFGETFRRVGVSYRSSSDMINETFSELHAATFALSKCILVNAQAIHRTLSSKNCLDVDLVENIYYFASDFGYRVRALLSGKERSEMVPILISFAVDWVTFTCSDCPPTDKRTFRWAVMALEFTLLATKGNNIFYLNHSLFSHLKHKVSCCMSLLISHFQMEDEDEIENESSSSSNSAFRTQTYSSVAYSQARSKGNNMEMSLSKKRKSWAREIQMLEDRRSKILAEFKLVGKVISTMKDVDGRDSNVDGDKNAALDFFDDLDDDFQIIAVDNVLDTGGDWKAPRIRWQQAKYIGGGSFGAVFEAINLDSGEMMAVKEIKFTDNQTVASMRRDPNNEMRVMKLLKHPHIVTYYGAEYHKDKVYIFMEFCSGGSLASLLEQGPIYEEYLVKSYTLQIVTGLEYLHKLNVVHRDIKPDNILIDAMGTLKLVDFGASKIIRDTLTLSRTLGSEANNVSTKHSLIGTPAYMAPEVITGEASGPGADIWALGCVVLQMITGKRPWHNLDNEWAIMYHLGVAAKHPTLPDSSQASPEAIDFLQVCFKRSATERPTAASLLAHPFLQTLEKKIL